jgi:hypothetical protein
MGRQIPNFMDQADEVSLLPYLRTIRDIAVIESFASSADDCGLAILRKALSGTGNE